MLSKGKTPPENSSGVRGEVLAISAAEHFTTILVYAIRAIWQEICQLGKHFSQSFSAAQKKFAPGFDWVEVSFATAQLTYIYSIIFDGIPPLELRHTSAGFVEYLVSHNLANTLLLNTIAALRQSIGRSVYSNRGRTIARFCGQIYLTHDSPFVRCQNSVRINSM